ncbi:GyrI-like domain-containing protein [Paenibacillus sp. YYML68]|uniref:AraC family transcriptional regulator n=1 Tax=Paenibacillus sp. YYML68 TaxID=2909250 RepID=UPI00248FEACA|nr:GyrI-like domain-containing protein [Paenibacillus sp. YYML68]
MDIRIEVIPNYCIAYVRQVGPYGPANALAMERLKSWALDNELLTDTAILFGIPQDDPRTTPPEMCRYDACIVLPEETQLDVHDVREGELSGGAYAVFRIKHTAEDIERAWAEIIPQLYRLGYQIEHKPIVERYTGELLREDYCELCVPVYSAL